MRHEHTNRRDGGHGVARRQRASMASRRRRRRAANRRTHRAHAGFVNAVVALPHCSLSRPVLDASVWSFGRTMRLSADGRVSCRMLTVPTFALSLRFTSQTDGAVGLVSASWDHSAKLWRCTGAAFELLRTLAEAATVWAVLSLSESMLLTGSADKAIRLYDPRHRSPKRASVRRAHRLRACAPRCARRRLPLCRQRFSHSALDHSTAPCCASLPLTRPTSTRLPRSSPGHFASSGEDKLVHVWSVESHRRRSRRCVCPARPGASAPYRHVPRAEYPNVSPASELVDLMCASSEGVVHVFSRDEHSHGGARAARPTFAERRR
jgi:hypothetical protein